MSDDELDDEDKAILKQMQALAEQIVAPELSLSEIIAIGERIDELSKRMKPKDWEFEHFALQLMARQGAFMQDFQAFYRKRAELDGKLFGPNHQ